MMLLNLEESHDVKEFVGICDSFENPYLHLPASSCIKHY